MSDLIERLCELQHDAYEAAAVQAGWQTQERSRKPWSEVPEANKATMRASMAVVVTEIGQQLGRLRNLLQESENLQSWIGGNWVFKPEGERWRQKVRKELSTATAPQEENSP